MLNIYTYVQGEKQLNKLLAKMGKTEHPHFIESFAHVDNITIERIEEMVTGSDEGYKSYYILYMPHERGQYQMSDARHLVHEDIRNGALNCKKV